MGAVFSSLDACFERQDLAHESAAALETSLVTSERSSTAAAKTSAQFRRMGQRLLLINCAMRMAAGKSSVGRSVRIASGTHTSDPSLRRFDGVTGIVAEYDVGTDTCTVDVGAMASTANLDDLEARLAQLQVLQETHGANSTEVRMRAQQLLNGIHVPMQLMEPVKIPFTNMIDIGIVSLDNARNESADGDATPRRDPIQERDHLQVLEEVSARLRSEGEFLLGSSSNHEQEVPPPSGSSGPSFPAGPPGDGSSAGGSSMQPPSLPPPSEASSSASTGRPGKRPHVSSGSSRSVEWGELLRADRANTAAEINRQVSMSDAGIGVAASPDDPDVLALHAEKMEALLDYAVDFQRQPARAASADSVDKQARLWLENGTCALAEAGAYAALRTPQLSPSIKFFTYPLASDPTTAVDKEAFDKIAAILPTLSDHELREFGLTDDKNKPCWTAMCHFAKEIDVGRREQAWAVNMLFAHEHTGSYVHGKTPTSNRRLWQAKMMLSIAKHHTADATIDGTLGRAMLKEAVEALPETVYCYSLDNDGFYQRVWNSRLVNAAQFRGATTEPLLSLFSESWERALIVSFVSSTTDTNGSKPLLGSGSFNRQSLFARLYGENDDAPLYAPEGSFFPLLGRSVVAEQMLEAMRRRAAARQLPPAPPQQQQPHTPPQQQQPPAPPTLPQQPRAPITPASWGTLAGHAIQGGANPARVALGLGPGGYSLTELKWFESENARAQGGISPRSNPHPRPRPAHAPPSHSTAGAHPPRPASHAHAHTPRSARVCAATKCKACGGNENDGEICPVSNKMHFSRGEQHL